MIDKIKAFFRKLFLVREIRSREGVLHFERWRLLNLGLFAIYIHRIFRSDEDKHAHSHPWWFFSTILAGGYIEERGRHGTLMVRGRWTTMGTDEFHKLTLIKPVTSFVITGPRITDWGYDTEIGYIESGEYRRLKQAGRLDAYIESVQEIRKLLLTS